MIKKVIAVLVMVAYVSTNTGVSYAQLAFKGNVEGSYKPLSVTDMQLSKERVTTSVLKNIDMPSQVGTFTVLYQGQQDVSVVIMKDAHCYYEAQRAAYDALKVLNEKYGFTTLYVEGAVGTIDPTLLAAYPNAATRLAVGDTLVQEASMNGSDYYTLMNPQALTVEGIEDRTLYCANYDALRTLYAQRDSFLPLITQMEANAQRLAKETLSQRLLELVHLLSRLKEEKDVSLAHCEEYVTLIVGYCTKYAIDMSQYPDLKKLIAVVQGKERLQESLNGLWHELLVCGDRLGAMLVRNDKERSLLRDLRVLEYLRKGITETLTSREYAELRSMGDFSVWNAMKHYETSHDSEAVYKRGVRAIMAFYNYVEKRNQALWETFQSKNALNGGKKVIITVGGYHADALIALCMKQDYSIAVFTPHLQTRTEYALLYQQQIMARSPHGALDRGAPRSLQTTASSVPSLYQVQNYFDTVWNDHNQQFTAFVDTVIRKYFQRENGNSPCEGALWEAYVTRYEAALSEYLQNTKKLDPKSSAFQTYMQQFQEACGRSSNSTNAALQMSKPQSGGISKQKDTLSEKTDEITGIMLDTYIQFISEGEGIVATEIWKLYNDEHVVCDPAVFTEDRLKALEKRVRWMRGHPTHRGNVCVSVLMLLALFYKAIPDKVSQPEHLSFLWKMMKRIRGFEHGYEFGLQLIEQIIAYRPTEYANERMLYRVLNYAKYEDEKVRSVVVRIIENMQRLNKKDVFSKRNGNLLLRYYYQGSYEYAFEFMIGMTDAHPVVRFVYLLGHGLGLIGTILVWCGLNMNKYGKYIPVVSEKDATRAIVDYKRNVASTLLKAISIFTEMSETIDLKPLFQSIEKDTDLNSDEYISAVVNLYKTYVLSHPQGKYVDHVLNVLQHDFALRTEGRWLPVVAQALVEITKSVVSGTEEAEHGEDDFLWRRPVEITMRAGMGDAQADIERRKQGLDIRPDYRFSETELIEHIMTPERYFTPPDDIPYKYISRLIQLYIDTSNTAAFTPRVASCLINHAQAITSQGKQYSIDAVVALSYVLKERPELITDDAYYLAILFQELQWLMSSDTRTESQKLLNVLIKHDYRNVITRVPKEYFDTVPASPISNYLWDHALAFSDNFSLVYQKSLLNKDAQFIVHDIVETKMKTLSYLRFVFHFLVKLYAQNQSKSIIKYLETCIDANPAACLNEEGATALLTMLHFNAVHADSPEVKRDALKLLTKITKYVAQDYASGEVQKHEEEESYERHETMTCSMGAGMFPLLELSLFTKENIDQERRDLCLPEDCAFTEDDLIHYATAERNVLHGWPRIDYFNRLMQLYCAMGKEDAFTPRVVDTIVEVIFEKVAIDPRASHHALSMLAQMLATKPSLLTDKIYYMVLTLRMCFMKNVASNLWHAQQWFMLNLLEYDYPFEMGQLPGHSLENGKDGTEYYNAVHDLISALCERPIDTETELQSASPGVGKVIMRDIFDTKKNTSAYRSFAFRMFWKVFQTASDSALQKKLLDFMNDCVDADPQACLTEDRVTDIILKVQSLLTRKENTISLDVRKAAMRLLTTITASVSHEDTTDESQPSKGEWYERKVMMYAPMADGDDLPIDYRLEKLGIRAGEIIDEKRLKQILMNLYGTYALLYSTPVETCSNLCAVAEIADTKLFTQELLEWLIGKVDGEWKKYSDTYEEWSNRFPWILYAVLAFEKINPSAIHSKSYEKYFLEGLRMHAYRDSLDGASYANNTAIFLLGDDAVMKKPKGVFSSPQIVTALLENIGSLKRTVRENATEAMMLSIEEGASREACKSTRVVLYMLKQLNASIRLLMKCIANVFEIGFANSVAQYAHSRASFITILEALLRKSPETYARMPFFLSIARYVFLPVFIETKDQEVCVSAMNALDTFIAIRPSYCTSWFYRLVRWRVAHMKSSSAQCAGMRLLYAVCEIREQGTELGECASFILAEMNAHRDDKDVQLTGMSILARISKEYGSDAGNEISDGDDMFLDRASVHNAPMGDVSEDVETRKRVLGIGPEYTFSEEDLIARITSPEKWLLPNEISFNYITKLIWLHIDCNKTAAFTPRLVTVLVDIAQNMKKGTRYACYAEDALRFVLEAKPTLITDDVYFLAIVFATLKWDMLYDTQMTSQELLNVLIQHDYNNEVSCIPEEYIREKLPSPIMAYVADYACVFGEGSSTVQTKQLQNMHAQAIVDDIINNKLKTPAYLHFVFRCFVSLYLQKPSKVTLERIEKCIDADPVVCLDEESTRTLVKVLHFNAVYADSFDVKRSVLRLLSKITKYVKQEDSTVEDQPREEDWFERRGMMVAPMNEKETILIDDIQNWINCIITDPGGNADKLKLMCDALKKDPSLPFTSDMLTQLYMGFPVPVVMAVLPCIGSKQPFTHDNLSALIKKIDNEEDASIYQRASETLNVLRLFALKNYVDPARLPLILSYITHSRDTKDYGLAQKALRVLSLYIKEGGRACARYTDYIQVVPLIGNNEFYKETHRELLEAVLLYMQANPEQCAIRTPFKMILEQLSHRDGPWQYQKALFEKKTTLEGQIAAAYVQHNRTAQFRRDDLRLLRTALHDYDGSYSEYGLIEYPDDDSDTYAEVSTARLHYRAYAALEVMKKYLPLYANWVDEACMMELVKKCNRAAYSLDISVEAEEVVQSLATEDGKHLFTKNLLDTILSLEEEPLDERPHIPYNSASSLIRLYHTLHLSDMLLPRHIKRVLALLKEEEKPEVSNIWSLQILYEMVHLNPGLCYQEGVYDEVSDRAKNASLLSEERKILFSILTLFTKEWATQQGIDPDELDDEAGLYEKMIHGKTMPAGMGEAQSSKIEEVKKWIKELAIDPRGNADLVELIKEALSQERQMAFTPKMLLDLISALPYHLLGSVVQLMVNTLPFTRGNLETLLIKIENDENEAISKRVQSQLKVLELFAMRGCLDERWLPLILSFVFQSVHVQKALRVLSLYVTEGGQSFARIDDYIKITQLLANDVYFDATHEELLVAILAYMKANPLECATRTPLKMILDQLARREGTVNYCIAQDRSTREGAIVAFYEAHHLTKHFERDDLRILRKMLSDYMGFADHKNEWRITDGVNKDKRGARLKFRAFASLEILQYYVRHHPEWVDGILMRELVKKCDRKVFSEEIYTYAETLVYSLATEQNKHLFTEEILDTILRSQAGTAISLSHNNASSLIRLYHTLHLSDMLLPRHIKRVLALLEDIETPESNILWWPLQILYEMVHLNPVLCYQEGVANAVLRMMENESLPLEARKILLSILTLFTKEWATQQGIDPDELDDEAGLYEKMIYGKTMPAGMGEAQSSKIEEVKKWIKELAIDPHGNADLVELIKEALSQERQMAFTPKMLLDLISALPYHLVGSVAQLMVNTLPFTRGNLETLLLKIENDENEALSKRVQSQLEVLELFAMRGCLDERWLPLILSFVFQSVNVQKALRVLSLYVTEGGQRFTRIYDYIKITQLLANNMYFDATHEELLVAILAYMKANPLECATRIPLKMMLDQLARREGSTNYCIARDRSTREGAIVAFYEAHHLTKHFRRDDLRVLTEMLGDYKGAAYRSDWETTRVGYSGESGARFQFRAFAALEILQYYVRHHPEWVDGMLMRELVKKCDRKVFPKDIYTYAETLVFLLATEQNKHLFTENLLDTILSLEEEPLDERPHIPYNSASSLIRLYHTLHLSDMLLPRHIKRALALLKEEEKPEVSNIWSLQILYEMVHLNPGLCYQEGVYDEVSDRAKNASLLSEERKILFSILTLFTKEWATQQGIDLHELDDESGYFERMPHGKTMPAGMGEAEFGREVRNILLSCGIDSHHTITDVTFGKLIDRFADPDADVSDALGTALLLTLNIGEGRVCTIGNIKKAIGALIVDESDESMFGPRVLLAAQVLQLMSHYNPRCVLPAGFSQPYIDRMLDGSINSAVQVMMVLLHMGFETIFTAADMVYLLEEFEKRVCELEKLTNTYEVKRARERLYAIVSKLLKEVNGEENSKLFTVRGMEILVRIAELPYERIVLLEMMRIFIQYSHEEVVTRPVTDLLQEWSKSPDIQVRKAALKTLTLIARLYQGESDDAADDFLGRIRPVRSMHAPMSSVVRDVVINRFLQNCGIEGPADYTSDNLEKLIDACYQHAASKPINEQTQFNQEVQDGMEFFFTHADASLITREVLFSLMERRMRLEKNMANQAAFGLSAQQCVELWLVEQCIKKNPTLLYERDVITYLCNVIQLWVYPAPEILESTFRLFIQYITAQEKDVPVLEVLKTVMRIINSDDKRIRLQGESFFLSMAELSKTVPGFRPLFTRSAYWYVWVRLIFNWWECVCRILSPSKPLAIGSVTKRITFLTLMKGFIYAHPQRFATQKMFTKLVSMLYSKKRAILPPSDEALYAETVYSTIHFLLKTNESLCTKANFRILLFSMKASAMCGGVKGQAAAIGLFPQFILTNPYSYPEGEGKESFKHAMDTLSELAKEPDSSIRKAALKAMTEITAAYAASGDREDDPSLSFLDRQAVMPAGMGDVDLRREVMHILLSCGIDSEQSITDKTYGNLLDRLADPTQEVTKALETALGCAISLGKQKVCTIGNVTKAIDIILNYRYEKNNDETRITAAFMALKSMHDYKLDCINQPGFLRPYIVMAFDGASSNAGPIINFIRGWNFKDMFNEDDMVFVLEELEKRLHETLRLTNTRGKRSAAQGDLFLTVWCFLKEIKGEDHYELFSARAMQVLIRLSQFSDRTYYLIAMMHMFIQYSHEEVVTRPVTDLLLQWSKSPDSQVRKAALKTLSFIAKHYQGTPDDGDDEFLGRVRPVNSMQVPMGDEISPKGNKSSPDYAAAYHLFERASNSKEQTLWAEVQLLLGNDAGKQALTDFIDVGVSSAVAGFFMYAFLAGATVVGETRYAESIKKRVYQAIQELAYLSDDERRRMNANKGAQFSDWILTLSSEVLINPEWYTSSEWVIPLHDMLVKQFAALFPALKERNERVSLNQRDDYSSAIFDHFVRWMRLVLEHSTCPEEMVAEYAKGGVVQLLMSIARGSYPINMRKESLQLLTMITASVVPRDDDDKDGLSGLLSRRKTQPAAMGDKQSWGHLSGEQQDAYKNKIIREIDAYVFSADFSQKAQTMFDRGIQIMPLIFLYSEHERLCNLLAGIVFNKQQCMTTVSNFNAFIPTFRVDLIHDGNEDDDELVIGFISRWLDENPLLVTQTYYEVVANKFEGLLLGVDMLRIFMEHKYDVLNMEKNKALLTFLSDDSQEDFWRMDRELAAYLVMIEHSGLKYVPHDIFDRFQRMMNVDSTIGISHYRENLLRAMSKTFALIIEDNEGKPYHIEIARATTDYLHEWGKSANIELKRLALSFLTQLLKIQHTDEYEGSEDPMFFERANLQPVMAAGMESMGQMTEDSLFDVKRIEQYVKGSISAQRKNMRCVVYVENLRVDDLRLFVQLLRTGDQVAIYAHTIEEAERESIMKCVQEYDVTVITSHENDEGMWAPDFAGAVDLFPHQETAVIAPVPQLELLVKHVNDAKRFPRMFTYEANEFWLENLFTVLVGTFQSASMHAQTSYLMEDRSHTFIPALYRVSSQMIGAQTLSHCIGTMIIEECKKLMVQNHMRVAA